jgi:hypothetical protein
VTYSKWTKLFDIVLMVSYCLHLQQKIKQRFGQLKLKTVNIWSGQIPLHTDYFLNPVWNRSIEASYVFQGDIFPFVSDGCRQLIMSPMLQTHPFQVTSDFKPIIFNHIYRVDLETDAPFTHSQMRCRIIPDCQSVMVCDSPWWSVKTMYKPCKHWVSSGSERKKLNMFDFSPRSSQTKINLVGSVYKLGGTM